MQAEFDNDFIIVRSGFGGSYRVAVIGAEGAGARAEADKACIMKGSSIHSRRSALLTMIFAPLIVAQARAEDLAPADLVLAREGTMPIILTVPHGGREAIPGAAPRDTRGRPSGGRGFVTVTDTNTDRLALGIAAQIKALTGKEPYLVLAKFERKYADPNRPPEIGVESPAARPYYDYYHRSIRRFIDEIRNKYPAGLLIDVHGQKKDPNVVMRGTQNGRTVKTAQN